MNVETTGNRALLVMDVQRAMVGNLADGSAYLDRLRPVIQSARDTGIPVIYVVVRFREGYPEAGSRNKSFSQIKGSGRLLEGTESAEIEPAVAPQPGEVVVTKKRVSAFAGSDLEVLLRAQEIEELVLTGIATSGVVLSTVRQAADKDYRLTVIADCCADADPEVHRVLTEKVFPGQANVVSAEEWKASISDETVGSGH